ncbi:MAG: hypothetical protein Q8L56_11030 [Rhodocyclaceae bacterium]|nr:hypothetical protein [Rhodocyclaceae bacterium]
MKNIKMLRQFCCWVVFAFSGAAFAQGMTLAQLQTELVSAWLVTIEGEERVRTLRITGATPSSENKLLLEATYGWIDGNQSSVVASVMQSGQTTMLQFATQAGSQVAAALISATAFEGTFTNNKGNTKAIKIQKLSEGELQAKVAAAKAARVTSVIIKPAPEVPEPCASFSGRWAGTWTIAGVRNAVALWVASVDASCKVKLAYMADSIIPASKHFMFAEVKDGALSFICNESTNGTCVFERRGDSLYASYSNLFGGRNSAVFEKVQ